MGKFYISGYTKETEKNGIALVDFNEDTEKLVLSCNTFDLVNPSYIVFNNDETRLYSVGHQSGKGKIAAYKILPNHEPELLDIVDCGEGSCCHLSVSPSGKYLAAANYHNGFVVIINLDEKGMFGKPYFSVNKGKLGPNDKRQNAPHAHCCVFDGDETFYTMDLGLDRIIAFSIKNGIFSEDKDHSFDVKSGNGPRHMIINKKHAYIANELSNTVDIYEKVSGKFEFVCSIDTLPREVTENDTVAAIRISPDGKELAVSNRGHNSLVFYELIDNGYLRLKQHCDLGFDHPRDFNYSKNGKYILVANQFSNYLQILKRERDGMFITEGKGLKINAPSCVLPI